MTQTWRRFYITNRVQQNIENHKVFCVMWAKSLIYIMACVFYLYVYLQLCIISDKTTFKNHKLPYQNSHTKLKYWFMCCIRKWTYSTNGELKTVLECFNFYVLPRLTALRHKYILLPTKAHCLNNVWSMKYMSIASPDIINWSSNKHAMQITNIIHNINWF